MPDRRTASGILLLLALMGLAYGLLTLPPKLLEAHRAAAEIGPVAAYAYLAAVALGGALLLGLGLYVVARLWANTRGKDAARRRRGSNPSELSADQRAAELEENLRSGRDYAASADARPKLRAEIERLATELERKRDHKRLEVVAFGTISSGKSSLLNALAGQEAFRSGVVGGTTTTRSSIPWPGNDQVVLVDTPGLAEVEGETHARESAQAADTADLVLFVVDGPLKSYERDLLDHLGRMEKRVVLCLNKEDWYGPREQGELLGQLREQAAPAVRPEDVVAVRSRATVRPVTRVLASGAEEAGQVTDPPDISPLAKRLVAIVQGEGGDLLLANLLLRSRGLVDDAKQQVLAALDDVADQIITRYMWAAGGATAVNPIPLLDLAGGSAITIKMVLDLAAVYKQKVDADAVVEMLSQLTKNLIAMLGASAAAPALGVAVASLLKTAPGVGSIAGGALQGTVQAVMTRWIGKVFCQYFRNEMKPPAGGLAEVARREWDLVTSADELRKLIRLGRSKAPESDAP